MEAPACCECVKCTRSLPIESFHWQVSIVQGERLRTRDKTCKACRASQKRQRDRTRQPVVADSVIVRFLSLPVPR